MATDCVRWGIAPGARTPYRAVSWTSTGEHDRIDGSVPAFDPCGAIVGYSRNCYSRPCRWYVDGPIGRISYFFVPPTNKQLDGWLRFNGIPQWDNEHYNVDDPGEISTSRKTYSKGNNPRPENDGSHPFGTAADFAGLSPVPDPFPGPASCTDGSGFHVYMKLWSVWWEAFDLAGDQWIGLKLVSLPNPTTAVGVIKFQGGVAGGGIPTSGALLFSGASLQRPAQGAILWAGSGEAQGAPPLSGSTLFSGTALSPGGAPLAGSVLLLGNALSAGSPPTDGALLFAGDVKSDDHRPISGALLFAGATLSQGSPPLQGGALLRGQGLGQGSPPLQGGALLRGQGLGQGSPPLQGSIRWLGNGFESGAPPRQGALLWNGNGFEPGAPPRQGALLWNGNAFGPGAPPRQGALLWNGNAFGPGAPPRQGALLWNGDQNKITLVQNGTVNQSNSAMSISSTFASRPTVGNAIVVCFFGQGVPLLPLPTVTDSAGNTYQAAGSVLGGGQTIGYAWAPVTSAGAGTFSVTFACTTNHKIGIFAQEFRGINGRDNTHSASGTSGTAAPGSNSSTHAHTMWKAGVSVSNTLGIGGPNTGYTRDFTDSSFTATMAISDQSFFTSTTTQNLSFTVGAGSNWSAAIAAWYH